MCGIVGYIGRDEALPVLLEGLRALEYRGYDSAGVAVFSEHGTKSKKSVGHVATLVRSLGAAPDFKGRLGIAHTRWATHGVPSEANAHPHTDCAKRVFVVHNGIIENYQELKNYLTDRGHTFVSETDTESAAHLIEEFIQQGRDFKTALFDALKMMRGAYAFAIVDAHNPELLYAARLSSPLVIGIDPRERIVASDSSALVGRTKSVIYLKDGEVAEIARDTLRISNLEQQPTPLEVVHLEWNLARVQKGRFPHFMLKEIFEGPEVVRAAFRGRLRGGREVKLGGLDQVAEQLRTIQRVVIAACGTSYYAGLIGEYLFEEIAQLPTEVHLASEFRYRDEPLNPTSMALVISQSGETADTLAALRKAKLRGLLTLGIVNVAGSTIARETDAGVHNHAGPEIGVASTKAFLSQITVLALMAVHFARLRGLHTDHTLEELTKIPEKIQRILSQSSAVETLAKKYKGYNNYLFLGRRYHYPTALEGALKLKEIAYVHAEGCGAGEMKHGPLAMIGPDFPTIAIAPQNGVAEKMHSNLEEIRARRGPIIAIATEGDATVASLVNDVFYIPRTEEPLEPLLAIMPLHLFAYYMGILRGCNVDKPRNLAKSVTVE